MRNQEEIEREISKKPKMLKKKLAFLLGIWYSYTDGKRETKSGRNSMKIFKEYNQNQTYLLPPSLEDFVGAETFCQNNQ